MITFAKSQSTDTVPAWHTDFLKLLPAIRRHASIAFRNLDPDGREEAVQEVICNAMVAYRRLFDLGKTDVAYASVLARYGVAQYRVGRKVGSRLNCKDVSSGYCQNRKELTVERLDRYDQEDQAWQEIVVEDRHAGPADIAACRIDFAGWLQTLTDRQRRIAGVLAMGESTKATARRFGLTDGRVSQVRRELKQAWEMFANGKPTANPAPAVV